jgi:hypothetical protein
VGGGFCQGFWINNFIALALRASKIIHSKQRLTFTKAMRAGHYFAEEVILLATRNYLNIINVLHM